MLHWCFASVVAAVLVGLCLHFIIRRITNNKHVIIHVDEFIGNVVSSVFILELFVISAKRGSNSIEAVAAGFIHLFFKHIYFMTFKLYGTPLSFFDIYYTEKKQRKFTLFEVLSILITQVIAILTGQQFAKFLWAFEDQTHVHRLNDVCMVTLSPHFSWQYAAVLEGFGVFLCTVVDFLTPHIIKPVVRSIMTLSLLFNFGHVSGLWMNPVLASIFTFRCKGHQSDWQHFIVYWIGPAIGFLLAWELKILYDRLVVTKHKLTPVNGKKIN